MITIGIKSYLKNIWYYFALLGFVCVGIIIGISIVVPFYQNAGQTFGNSFQQILSTTKINPDPVINKITESVKGLNWTNPTEALSTLTNKDWLYSTIYNALKDYASSEEIQAISSDIVVIVDKFVLDIATGFGIFFGMLSAGAVVGYIVIHLVIQLKNIKSINLIRYIIGLTFDILLFTGILYLIYYTVPKWQDGFYVIMVGSLILVTFGSLLISWFVYGNRFVKFFEVVNFKNILLSLLVYTIMFALSIGIIALLSKTLNIIALSLLSVPLIAITFIIVDTCANTYTGNLSLERRNKYYSDKSDKEY